jgi:DnaJ-class molecular chaperone
MNKYKRPTGGRGKKANYETVVMRVPVPIQREVEDRIAQFHEENQRYRERPIMGQWWQILGVPPSASKDEIKVAYRQLAQEYHPDNNKKTDAHERFHAISEARQAGERSQAP